jgi:hypothetical protein
MGLLILGALVLAVGMLLLIGVLIVAEDLYSESAFGMPDQIGEVTQRQGIDEERAAFARRGR